MTTAAVAAPVSPLSPEDRAVLRRIEGPPFGRDAAGRRLSHGSGRPTVGVVRHLLATVAARAERNPPPDLSPAEIAKHIEQSKQAALDRLVAMLNASIPDDRQRISAEMLFDESVNWSLEFWAVLDEYASFIAGDADLIDSVGPHMVPRSIAQLARPLGVVRAFGAVGRFANMFIRTDLRTVELTPTSAVVRWYGRPELLDIPESNRRLYLSYACRTYRSTLGAVPSTVFGGAPATVRDVVCINDGAEYCEWHFAWQASEDRVRIRELALGAVAAVLVVAAAVLRLPFWDWIAVGAAAILPIALVLYGSRLRGLAEQLRQQRTMLEEQRDAAERELTRSDAARQELLVANVDLERGMSELSALHEVGQALGATLDLDELIERSLLAVARNLGYERAMVLLADEQGRALGDARSVGGGGRNELLASLRIPLEDRASPIVQAFAADVPTVVDDVARHPHAETRRLAEALGVESFLAAPLLTKGKRIGVLAVDRGRSGARVDPADGPLVFTAGTGIAAAIETARLYATLEEQNRRLEARVHERTSALESARESAEQARATAEIQRQEIERLLTISPVATVVVAETDGRITRWNPAAERLFGWRADEAVGQVLNELVAPGNLRAEADHLDRTSLREAGGVKLVTRRARKDGTLVDVDILAAPLVVDGERVGGIAIYHDVSELQQARAAAEQARAAAEQARALAEIQRQEIENLVTISPVATVAVDRDGLITRWNPAAEKLFGWRAEEALGKVLNDMIAPGDLRSEADKLDTSFYSDGAVKAVTRRARMDGSLVDVEILAGTIVMEGEPVGGIAIYHDISELQQARAAAEEARAAAEEANRSKSAFLAMMSHEIRTPMNAVIGMSGLLLDTPLNAEQREYAETIRTSGDALLTIINDILDFSKIEAGRMELESAPFDLAECIEGALDLVAPLAAKKGLEVAYVVDGSLPAGIVGDVGRLRQVLLNLLGNAVKFTEQGEVEVRASSEPAGEGRARVRVAVRDTGIGLSEVQMGRLFQSFSQADASTNRRFGGTGLGLAISRRLAELMGGTVTASSPGPGLGSTFAVELEAQVAEVTGGRRRRRLDRLPALAGRRVLVVDDNETNRRIVSAQLGAWGMTTRATESPSEALAWLRAGESFDLAILDLRMPEMDGVALAAAVRQLRGDAVPVIMLSSVRIGRTPAVAANLTKPVKPSDLLDAVVSTLHVEEPRVDGDAPSEPGAAAAVPDVSPIRLLLAEDNAVNQKVALRMLSKLGYRADVAANGLEVLEALDRQPYDAILMDVQMPELDGLETTRRIRAQSAGPSPHIIAMTANAMSGDREACMEAGMNDYISKPVREPELAAALARAAVAVATA